MFGCQNDDWAAVDELAMKLCSAPSLLTHSCRLLTIPSAFAASTSVYAAELLLVLQCSAWRAARRSCRVANAGCSLALLRESRPPRPLLPFPPPPPCCPDSRERSSAGSSSSPLQQLMLLYEWSFQYMP